MNQAILQKGVKMKISIRADSVVIEGYVNAIERNSKPLISRIGRFIERICKGAFSRALQKNDDVHVLMNHDWNRDLGSTKQGNLELKEDSIGLHARVETSDPDTVRDAKEGNLVGWSFGFTDTLDGVERSTDSETGLPLRLVRDLDLYEVSILNREKSPAYEGTLIMAREDGDIQFLFGEEFTDEIEVRAEWHEGLVDEPKSEIRVEDPEQTEQAEETATEEQPQQDEHPEAIKVIDYSRFEAMISEMKGEQQK